MSQILSSNTVNLDGQGFGIDAYSDLMYSMNNVEVHELETVTRWSDVISAGSLNFGSTFPISLMRELFVDYVVLRAELYDLRNGEAVCNAWLPAMIQSVSYLLGSSSSTEITLSGDALYQALCAQNQTLERRNYMVQSMGEAQFGVIGPLSNAVKSAYLVLPLPFSNANSQKKPLDTTLLNY